MQFTLFTQICQGLLIKLVSPADNRPFFYLVPGFGNTMTYKNKTGSQDEPDRLLSGSSDDKAA